MNRTPLPRPTLVPGLARVWRTATHLQLGLGPPHAIVLELADPRTALVLDLLDGRLSERLVLLRAAEQGVPVDDALTLLGTLQAAGLVIPAGSLMPAALPDRARQLLLCEAAAMALETAGPAQRAPAGPSPARVLRRRRASRVVISGRGRLGATIAVALAEAGVGHVHPDLSGAVGPSEITGGPLLATDAGSPRRTAVTAAILRASPVTETRTVRRPPTLVVQLAHDEPTALIAAGHAARRQPHLAVGIRDGTAVVGPFVPVTGEPCLRCLDLHRLDRDPGRPGGCAADTAEPCTVTTLLAATAYAVAEALAFLDGGIPGTTGSSVEISAPGRIRRRTWPPHPDCPCGRNRATFTRPSPHKHQTTS
ncbi:thiamine biosynthesis protein ThiF [Actinoplanes rectilineatus]|uniref:thiamine biosynthesis protein ThiF n=1 Tax=Actinoplanes rectilineatus TaxID=113571 RepID=UPI0005F2EE46|nr:thiamine biosynthesis protein ThiF [Actinoplanes rectilineatus]